MLATAILSANTYSLANYHVAWHFTPEVTVVRDIHILSTTEACEASIYFPSIPQVVHSLLTTCIDKFDVHTWLFLARSNFAESVRIEAPTRHSEKMDDSRTSAPNAAKLSDFYREEISPM